jgi:hypothetical protein
VREDVDMLDQSSHSSFDPKLDSFYQTPSANVSKLLNSHNIKIEDNSTVEK